MSAGTLQGPDALLALIDDLTQRVAQLEKVVRDGSIRATEVVAQAITVERPGSQPHVRLEAHEEWADLTMATSRDIDEAMTLTLVASDESPGGHVLTEYGRHGNGLAHMVLFGSPNSRTGTHASLWMAEPDDDGNPGADADLDRNRLAVLERISEGQAAASDGELAERVAALEAWQAERAEQVVTKTVRAERVEVREPGDTKPTVLLQTGGDGVVVGNGRPGPHVTIGADRGGDRDMATGRSVPPQAGLCVWADEDEMAVSVEGSKGHPGRRSLGQIEILRGDHLQTAAVVLADDVRAHAVRVECPENPATGSVWLTAGERWGAVSVRAEDADVAPAVTIHAGTENLDDRGRDLGEAQVVVRHNDQDAVRLGCTAPANRPGAGYVAVCEGTDEGMGAERNRITLGVKAGQAEVGLWSEPGDDLVLDAGPEGTAVAVRAPGASGFWLDRDGLRRS